MLTLKFKKTEGNEDICLPKFQTTGAAAFDLHAAVKESIIIEPGQMKLIPTGLQMEFPRGYVASIVPRSGLALKNGITLVNSPATIDSDYRGEVGIILINHSETSFKVNRNDRIAQMMIIKHEHPEIVFVDELSPSDRGNGGFGSSGK